MPTRGPYQLPVVDLAAGGERLGRLWRKVVLPIGRVKHGERVLDFGRPTLERIAANFRARAFDSVLLVLATPDNRHNEDPTRYAGRVREMAATDRGLEIGAELNDLGRRVLEASPWIGASVRYFAGFRRAHDGPLSCAAAVLCRWACPTLGRGCATI